MFLNGVCGLAFGRAQPIRGDAFARDDATFICLAADPNFACAKVRKVAQSLVVCAGLKGRREMNSIALTILTVENVRA